jgi:chemotaxis protein histidine kinase CheA
VKTAREFLDLLHNDRVKQKLIKGLNPLNEVEINLLREDGGYENRYFGFQFSRMPNDGSLDLLLVSVTDETERVLLARELAETKDRQDTQIEQLVQILHTDRSQLELFFNSAATGLQNISSAFNSLVQSDRDAEEKLAGISRAVHQIKGEAAALALDRLELTTDALGDELVLLTTNNEVSTGRALLPAIAKFKDLRISLERMRWLTEKLDRKKTSDFVEKTPHYESTEPSVSVGLADSLQDLVKIASRVHDKRVHLNTLGLNLEQLPELLQEPFQTIATNLVRNSIFNSSGSPQDRLQAGKTDYINITASLNKIENNFTLLVRDDGEGFDNQLIIERAIELGIIESDDLDRISRKEAFKLVFHPHFSSADDIAPDEGCSVGLGLVHAMVKGLGGVIGVKHMPGQYCQFKVTIPNA